MAIDTETLTRADVAWLVGMSDSWVRDRMQAGDLPRPGQTAEEYVEAFVAFRLRKYEQAGEDGDTLSFDRERARLTKEQADSKEMDNAERRKELASLPDMTIAVMGVISMAVSRLTQVPALVAKGDETLRQRIEIAITDALDELSLARVEEMRSGGVDEEDASDDEPA